MREQETDPAPANLITAPALLQKYKLHLTFQREGWLISLKRLLGKCESKGLPYTFYLIRYVQWSKTRFGERTACMVEYFFPRYSLVYSYTSKWIRLNLFKWISQAHCQVYWTKEAGELGVFGIGRKPSDDINGKKGRHNGRICLSF